VFGAFLLTGKVLAKSASSRKLPLLTYPRPTPRRKLPPQPAHIHSRDSITTRLQPKQPSFRISWLRNTFREQLVVSSVLYRIHACVWAASIPALSKRHCHTVWHLQCDYHCVTAFLFASTGHQGQTNDMLNTANKMCEASLLRRVAVSKYAPYVWPRHAANRASGLYLSSVTFPLCTPIIITQFTNIVESLILIKRYACARAVYRVTKQGRLTRRQTQTVPKIEAARFNCAYLLKHTCSVDTVACAVHHTCSSSVSQFLLCFALPQECPWPRPTVADLRCEDIYQSIYCNGRELPSWETQYDETRRTVYINLFHEGFCGPYAFFAW
jgi:hypothetical protein